MSKAVLLCLVIISLCLGAAAQSNEHPPSTSKDRQRVVAIAKKMEEKPLDNGQMSDRLWALRWVEDVPDVHVDLCKEVLGGLADSEYKYKHLLTVQLTLASASFLIQHPDKADDQMAEFTAGVESVLRAYKAILKNRPREHSRDLDELLDKQGHGQLEDFIKQAAESCNSDEEPDEDMQRGS